jgi:hypothetical protein
MFGAALQRPDAAMWIPPAGTLLRLDAPTFGAFLHETVSHTSEGEAFDEGPFVGTETAKNFFVVDDPTDVHAYGFQSHDHAGVATSPVTLVDNGCVSGSLVQNAGGQRLFSNRPGEEILVRSTRLYAGAHTSWGQAPSTNVVFARDFVRAAMKPKARYVLYDLQVV